METVFHRLGVNLKNDILCAGNTRVKKVCSVQPSTSSRFCQAQKLSKLMQSLLHILRWSWVSKSPPSTRTCQLRQIIRVKATFLDFARIWSPIRIASGKSRSHTKTNPSSSSIISCYIVHWGENTWTWWKTSRRLSSSERSARPCADPAHWRRLCMLGGTNKQTKRNLFTVDRWLFFKRPPRIGRTCSLPV